MRSTQPEHPWSEDIRTLAPNIQSLHAIDDCHQALATHQTRRLVEGGPNSIEIDTELLASVVTIAKKVRTWGA